MIEPAFTLIFQEEHFVKGDRVMLDSRDSAVVTKVYRRTRWRRFWTYLGVDMGLVSNGIKYKVKLIH